MMELSNESASPSPEINDRIRRHLDTYEKELDACKSAVEELNRKGADIGWLRKAMTKVDDPPWLLTVSVSCTGRICTLKAMEKSCILMMSSARHTLFSYYTLLSLVGFVAKASRKGYQARLPVELD